MHKVFHHGDDVDRLYVSRKEGEREHASMKIALTHRYDVLKTT